MNVFEHVLLLIVRVYLAFVVVQLLVPQQHWPDRVVAALLLGVMPSTHISSMRKRT